MSFVIGCVLGFIWGFTLAAIFSEDDDNRMARLVNHGYESALNDIFRFGGYYTNDGEWVSIEIIDKERIDNG